MTRHTVLNWIRPRVTHWVLEGKVWCPHCRRVTANHFTPYGGQAGRGCCWRMRVRSYLWHLGQVFQCRQDRLLRRVGW